MSESQSPSILDLPPPSSALLLCGEQTTPEDRNLTRVLDFFAIPWKAARAHDRDVQEPQGKYVILSSADCLAEAMQDDKGPGEVLPPCVTKASTAYVYGFQRNDRSTKLLRFLTGNPQANVRPLLTPKIIMTITSDSPEMCGPMSGMQVPVTPRVPLCVCDVGRGAEAFHSIVRADAGEVFFGVTCAGVRIYLNASSRTLDLSALSAEYFDVKKSFCESVPLIFYLKWAFRQAAWTRDETSACLIVDDPPLKRRYGFLDFREALDLMDHHNFTTTIAFIPWNWRRTHPPTLSLFQRYPERFSLVVHGCDHTLGEFAERSPARLNQMLRTSIQRMECFERSASIKTDRVMVFPEGEFSPETGRALKLNGFDTAVNTEVAPIQPEANQTQIGDLWNVAIMRYGSFPIFTRRPPRHGIENFAFDALLGKPCLITAHHDIFRDHGRHLLDFVARLNSLKWNLVWRPLGEAVRRSFAIRRLEDGTRVIQLFASSLVVENPSAIVDKTLILKEEGDTASVQAVLVNDKPVEFDIEGGYLRVPLTTLPGETAMVRVVYRNDLETIPARDGSRYKMKVAAKRYFAEFRDNYLSRNDFLYQGAVRLKRLMK